MTRRFGKLWSTNACTQSQKRRSKVCSRYSVRFLLVWLGERYAPESGVTESLMRARSEKYWAFLHAMTIKVVEAVTPTTPTTPTTLVLHFSTIRIEFPFIPRLQ